METTKPKMAFAIFAMLAVSACGGSSLSPQEQLDRIFELGDDIDERLDDQDVLAASSLPSSGAATYRGAIAALGGTGDPGEDTDVPLVLFAGELEATINFGAGTLEGTGSKFVAVENVAEIFADTQSDAIPVSAGEVSGSLTLAGSQGQSPDATYEILVNGELSDENGARLNYNDVSASVDVKGDGATGIEVFGGANVTFDDEPGFIAVFGDAVQ